MCVLIYPKFEIPINQIQEKNMGNTAVGFPFHNISDIIKVGTGPNLFFRDPYDTHKTNSQVAKHSALQAIDRVSTDAMYHISTGSHDRPLTRSSRCLFQSVTQRNNGSQFVIME
jgi:hypothetical protein